MPDHAVSESGAVRLKTMEKTNDGFEIAEVDLKLRGPGDFLGTKQSGLPEFKYADILQDQVILKEAKREARAILAEDPQLTHQKHSNLKRFFEPYHERKKKFYGLA